MTNSNTNEPLLDLFIYETSQNLEQLESLILASENAGRYGADAINEIFRIMHTIKGSSAMMMYNNISMLTHSLEDMFYVLREEKPDSIDYLHLTDIILDGVDFIKLELEKVKNSDELDGDPSSQIESIKSFLDGLKTGPEESLQLAGPGPLALSADPSLKSYEATIYFTDGCEMENVRAYGIVVNLADIAASYSYWPTDIMDNADSVALIRENGFKVSFQSDKDPRDLHDFFARVMFVRDLELVELGGPLPEEEQPDQAEQAQATVSNLFHQSIISVDVAKLDRLMELMGEMVIAEAMVTQNPELAGLEIDEFIKASRQLRKITSEMQDMVMSIRMVSLAAIFHKMRRLVRDMGRKLAKEIKMELVGENTEVDKNIIEHISDPLMHLVRNAIDHGLESTAEREAAGKPAVGTVTLEALNAGNDVVVMVRDDGRGLDRDKILSKAIKNGLVSQEEGAALSDREIYNMILLPGFSTNENITEYSGRGVGMDVVVKNIETVGGAVSLDSALGIGTVVTLKIPLTLAIIDGMNIRVGQAKYTLPTTSIRETFQARPKDLLQDPEGNEMIMVRGECYPIFRIDKEFEINGDAEELEKGIMLMVEQDNKNLCLFADELLGQQQVVVKPLPHYIKNISKVEGLAGCTLLGDGGISLILNIGGLINMSYY